MCKYGDLYLRLYRQSDYGDDILFNTTPEKEDRTLNEGSESVKEDVNLKLNHKNDHYVHYLEEVANPGEMFELTRFGKTMGYIQAPTQIQETYNKMTSTVDYYRYKMKKNDVNVSQFKRHAFIEK